MKYCHLGWQPVHTFDSLSWYHHPELGSISAKAVTMDVVDMLVGEDQMGQLMWGMDRA